MDANVNTAHPRAQPPRRLGTAALLALAAIWATTACSSEPIQGAIVLTDAGSNGDISWVANDTGAQPDLAGGEDLGQTGEDTGPQDLNREIIVLFDISQPRVIGPAQVLPIPIKVIDYSAGAPADGVPVFWEILPPEETPDLINTGGAGALDTLMTGTDAKGQTGNVFRPNTDPLKEYRLRLSAEGAEDVVFDIWVTDTPKGGIRIKMKYDNGVPLAQTLVRVLPLPFTCASFSPIYPDAGYIGSKATFLTDEPEFIDLPADKKYGVYVVAKDVNNQLTAAGCADGILVVDKQITEVTLTVQTLALQASGSYDMVNNFDFTGAIPGQLGEILDTAVQIFYDPGAFIIEQVKNLVKNFIGGGFIVDAAFGLFEDALADLVSDWLLNSSPSWLQDFFTIGQDVLQIVKKLEMLGILNIYKISNEFFVKGEINFTGLNLYWKLGCDKNDPNYADCGKITLDAKDAVNDPNFPLDFLAGDFTATVSAQRTLTINSSTITLNYGKLILWVLTDIVLYQITGEKSFQAAMSKLVNCSGIASGIGNSILGDLGLSESFVKGACESAVGLLVLPVENLLGGLKLDTNLQLSGECKMVDDNPPPTQANGMTGGDLKVDKLVEGSWVGNIVSDQPGNPFKGTFSAIRQEGF